MHASIHACMYACIHSFVRLFVCSFARSYITRSFTHSFNLSFVNLSASRSPPGLGALLVSSSAHFGVIFGVVFGSWGQYGGAAGSFFGADGDLARQRRLKRRLPQNKLTILDPSWEPKPTKNDQKSMPRCVQILHWFSDRFLIDFGP